MQWEHLAVAASVNMHPALTQSFLLALKQYKSRWHEIRQPLINLLPDDATCLEIIDAMSNVLHSYDLVNVHAPLDYVGYQQPLIGIWFSLLFPISDYISVLLDWSNTSYPVSMTRKAKIFKEIIADISEQNEKRENILFFQHHIMQAGDDFIKQVAAAYLWLFILLEENGFMRELLYSPIVMPHIDVETVKSVATNINDELPHGLVTFIEAYDALRWETWQTVNIPTPSEFIDINAIMKNAVYLRNILAVPLVV